MKEITNLEKIIEPILDEMGIELIEATLFHKGGRLTLCVVIDKEDGVMVEDTSKVSSMLGNKLDEVDLIDSNYDLEVSSPGIERKLTKLSHFKRFKGSKVKLKTIESIEGTKVFEGIIQEVEIDSVLIDIKGNVLSFKFDNISKARLVVDLNFGNKTIK